MTDFNTALDRFIAAVNADTKAYYEKNFKNLSFGPNPEDDTNGVYVHGGNKYIKLATKSGAQHRMYCFVAAVDVPNKNVKAGDVLMAASWKAPALKRKNPAAANIFEPASYETKALSHESWLYA
jgi:hypothetical protein